MSANHDDIVDVSVTLAPAPLSQAGFGRVLILATDLSFSGGEPYKIYETTEAVDNDTDLTSAQADAANTVLAQSPSPSDVMVAPFDKTGGDSASDAIQDVLSADGEFYGVALESKDAADIISASDKVEALNKVLFAQSADAELLIPEGPFSDDVGAGTPGIFNSIAGNTRTVLYYHDTDTEFLGAGHAASRLVFDPDTQSAGFQGAVAGVAPYSSSITDSEEANAESNNINLMLPFGNIATYVSQGVTIQGNPISELVSADWFQARLSERFITLKQAYDARGEKIPLSPTGQNIARGEIETQFAIGVTNGHFLGGDDQPTVSFPDPIPDGDITSQTLRASASAQFATNAANFDIDINLDRL